MPLAGGIDSGSGAANQAAVYDADGNLRFDGRWTMTWDGENRLVKLERPAWTQPTGGFMAPANPQGIPPNELSAMTIEFKYDGLSRLVERKVTRGIDAPEVEGYQWDGWKLIMIAKLNTDGTFHSRKWSCVWRPDMGSSLYARSDWMRAGGVGGVAWLQTGAVQSYSYGTGGAEVHVPLADHMGNVRHYYQFKSTKGNVTGQLVASYEYDAFGREVRAWGLNTPTENQPPGLPASRPWADHLPFHYSSKLRDVDSGFNYYGYRFYDPGAGRWLNRDPIGERGGVNLYGMVTNNLVRYIDTLGRAVFYVDGGLQSNLKTSDFGAQFLKGRGGKPNGRIGPKFLPLSAKYCDCLNMLKGQLKSDSTMIDIYKKLRDAENPDGSPVNPTPDDIFNGVDAETKPRGAQTAGQTDNDGRASSNNLRIRVPCNELHESITAIHEQAIQNRGAAANTGAGYANDEIAGHSAAKAKIEQMLNVLEEICKCYKK